MNIYVDGVLTARMDDATRTYTTYNPDGSIASTRPYTAAENAQADEDARQDAQITSLEGRVAALEAYVFKATPPGSGNAQPWDSSSAGYPPGATVTYDGHTWKNESGAWLNASYVPGDAEHPFWTQLPDPGETPTPWTDGMPLTTGELVSTDDGHVWRYLGTDIASAPANWKPTVANATWAAVS